MRLNNDMRYAMVSAVYAHVTDGGLEEALRNALVAHFVSIAPAPVRAVWEQPDLRCFVNTQGVGLCATENGLSDYDDDNPAGRISMGAHVPAGDYCYSTHFCTKVLFTNPAIKTAFDAWRAWVMKREALRTQVRAILATCNTTEQVMKVLPELEKYLPKEAEKTPNLPVATSVAILMADLGVPPDSIDK